MNLRGLILLALAVCLCTATAQAAKMDGEIRSIDGQLEVGWARFDISAIPDGDTVTAIEFHFYVNDNFYPYWSGQPLVSDPLTADGPTLWADITAHMYPDPSHYFYRQEDSILAMGWHSEPLINGATADLQESLPQDWFALGIADTDGYSDSSDWFIEIDGWADANPPYLLVTHSSGTTTCNPTAATFGTGTTDDAPSGACCYNDGSCADLTSGECFATFGNYEGDGTECASTDCSQYSTGACCLIDGSCVETDQYDCEVNWGGTYQGGGTDCGTHGCGVYECPPDALFSQERNDSSAYIADLDYPQLLADNFAGVSGPICDIHFWGIYYAYDLGMECTEIAPQDFIITFYHDGGGLPGAIACTYPVSITGSETGIAYAGAYPILHFEADLSPCCMLSEGWVSIAGTGGDPDCNFFMITSSDGDTASAYSLDLVTWLSSTVDYAFCLTPEDAPGNTTIGLAADQECYETDDTVTVWINLVTPDEAITGGQFFMEYDNTILDFEGFGPGSDPFDNLIYEVVDEGAGTLDVAVGVPPGHPGATTNTTMVVLTFTALHQICAESGLVAFRPHTPPSRLSNYYGESVDPVLVDLDVVDTTPPVITCPPDMTVECDDPTDPAPTWNHKMHFPQLPDPYGWDVHSDWDSALGACYLADDWECSETGPVEDIHFWGSWANDINGNTAITFVEVAIFSDVPDPDGDGPLYSMPGALLWDEIVYPEYITITEMGPYDPPSIQGYYNPCTTDYFVDNHTNFYRYDIENISDFALPFIQTQGEVYWLYILFHTGPLPDDAGWGWKTSTDHWNDSATSGDWPAWYELVDPLTSEPLDLAFVITAGPMNPGEATAIDNCDPAPVITWSDVEDFNGCGGYTGTITRTWTATDHCGNSVSCVQTITVVDTTPPTITCPAPVSVQCSGDLPAVDTGSVTATDNCDLAPVVTHVGDVSDGLSCPETITRTYRAIDACGNFADCTQLITVHDTIPPSVACPTDIVVNADAGGCNAIVSWMTPVASDNCDPSPAVVCVPPPGPGFTGTTTVTCTATDNCGNVGTCSFNVTVLPYNDLNVTLELSPTINTDDPFPQVLTRCITFELWDCGVPSGPTMLQKDVAFDVTQPGGPGTPILAVGTVAIDDLPCGTYTCITARDELHSLRRTMPVSFTGTAYAADFATALKPLTGGNFNDDGWIDILDFGVFSWQHFAVYGSGDTPCVTAAPHADASGDGIVDSDDFSFIQINFLEGSEANCCTDGYGASPKPPVTSITVEELHKRGLGELAVADYNGDGVLNTTDMTVFMGGDYLQRNRGEEGPQKQ